MRFPCPDGTMLGLCLPLGLLAWRSAHLDWTNGLTNVVRHPFARIGPRWAAFAEV